MPSSCDISLYLYVNLKDLKDIYDLLNVCSVKLCSHRATVLRVRDRIVCRNGG